MSNFKCKMCGGPLEIHNNETVVTCEYCGTKQTLPKLDDDRRANLYDRANHFRRNNEFDKAMRIYEQILDEDNRDAEAYWSLVLCRYGIEYVEDPSSHKRIPTVNRAQFTSIFDDDNYKSALQYADGYQRSIYEEEAKSINEIQKGILAISSQEEPFDVFICYKETDNNGRRTPDSVLANDLYHLLTQEGFKVFFARITLEDKPGSSYEPYIFAALNSAKVMVVLGTKPEYFNAVWVKNEWSRYLALIKQGQKKILIPAYKDMDSYDLPEEFSHLQAQDMSKIGFMQDLIRCIKKIAQVDAPKTDVVKEMVISGGNANTAPLLKRAFMFLEDEDWNSANEYCEKVLDIDPENASAYLGKLLSELRVRKQEALKDQAEPFDHNNNYQKAVRFADEKLKSALTGYIEHINTRNAKNVRKETERIAKRNKKIAVITTSIVCAVIAFIIVLNTVIIPNGKVGKLKVAKVGDYVFFGAYEQDNNTTNGKEDIEWLVLAKEGTKILVISKEALDSKSYKIDSNYRGVTWENCILREWLNNDFINEAFSAEEKVMIPTVTVSAENTFYGVDPGNATQDQVFLLSVTEVNKYFSFDSARQCKATDYAVANGALVDDYGNCYWWLRSPGNLQILCAYVDNVGGVDEQGSSVFNSYIAVRPALWIDLNS